MLLPSPGGYSFTAVLGDEQATEALVRDIAALIEPGDLITLSGDLGAGKTTFARAFIRHIAGNDLIEVPSPTFTLMQVYELPVSLRLFLRLFFARRSTHLRHLRLAGQRPDNQRRRELPQRRLACVVDPALLLCSSGCLE